MRHLLFFKKMNERKKYKTSRASISKMSSHKSNSTFNQTISFIPTNNGSYGLLVTTSITLIVSVVCFLYIHYKLTLNKYIKAILYIMAIFYIAASGLMSVANTTMIFQSNKSPITCQILTKSIFLIAAANRPLNSLISILR